ncbi:MAG: ribosome biogenesis GTPase YlqF [Pseudomonadota bacterium]
MAIQWYPGHMHKATKEIKQNLSKVDVIIEVLDARLPYSSQNPVIQALDSQKPRIKLLNKQDLADPEITAEWIEAFKQTSTVNALAVSASEQGKVKHAVHTAVEQFVSINKRSTRSVNALITGIPNVGKSTLINGLAGKHIAKTGNEPAVTKGMQRIDCGQGLMLFDTPGILWPKIHNEHSGYRLAFTGAIKNTAMDADDVAFYACEYVMTHYPEQLMAHFKLDQLPETEMELFQAVGENRGRLGKGGKVNLYQMTEIFLNELRAGLIGRLSYETPAMIEREEAVLRAKAAKDEQANR